MAYDWRENPPGSQARKNGWPEREWRPFCDDCGEEIGDGEGDIFGDESADHAMRCSTCLGAYNG